MWRLPLDLSNVTLDLEEGTYLLPWYWTDHDIDRVVYGLAQVLPDIAMTLELPHEGIEAYPAKIPSGRNTMVVVRAIPEGQEAAIDTLDGWLGCPYRFVQPLRPDQEERFDWAQVSVRSLLTDALRDQFGDAGHPLGAWKVRNLDVGLADRLASDVAELIALVEDTVTHRLGLSDLGLDRRCYLRSLLVATGRRLSTRLLRIGAEEIGPAVEVLLSEDRAVASAKRGRIGVDALLRSGLGRGGSDEVRLAALATPLAHVEVWGQLWQRLPHEAWTPLARDLLRQLRTDRKSQSRRVVTEEASGVAAARRGDVDVSTLRSRVAERLDDVETGLAAIDVIDALQQLPTFLGSLTAGLDQRSAACLSRLSRDVNTEKPEAQDFVRVLHAAVNLWSANGEQLVEKQRSALDVLEEACSRIEKDRACEDLLGAGRITLARSIANAPSTKRDLVEAERLATIERQRAPAGSRARAQVEAILGRTAHLQGRTEDAERWYGKALSGFEAIGDKVGMTSLHYGLGWVAQDRGEFDDALQHYLRALSHAEELDDRETMGSSALALGDVGFLKSDHETARSWYQRSLETFEALGDASSRSVVHRKLGMVDEESGLHDSARRQYQQALELDERLGNRASLASSHHHMGNVAYRIGELEQAKRWYGKALENFNELGNRTGKASALHQLGLVEQRLGNASEALELYDKALAIFTLQKNLSGMAAVFHQLGMAASETCDVDQAMDHFQRSLDVKRQQGDDSGAASSMSQIGVLHTQCGRPEEGVGWNIQAVGLRRRLGLRQSRLDLHWLGKQREMIGEKQFLQFLKKRLDSSMRPDEVIDLIDTSRQRSPGRDDPI